MTTTASAQTYREGQVWEYKTRPNESGSLLKIAKVESHPKLGDMFHVSIVGVKVRNPHAPTGFTTELTHLPVSRTTLDGSVTRLSESRVTFPDYRDGYATWKKAFDRGQAGVFTMSVSEIITVVEDGLSGKSR